MSVEQPSALHAYAKIFQTDDDEWSLFGMGFRRVNHPVNAVGPGVWQLYLEQPLRRQDRIVLLTANAISYVINETYFGDEPSQNVIGVETVALDGTPTDVEWSIAVYQTVSEVEPIIAEDFTP